MPLPGASTVRIDGLELVLGSDCVGKALETLLGSFPQWYLDSVRLLKVRLESYRRQG